MAVIARLPVVGVWNGGSELQAGLEIYYWEHPNFGWFRAAKMTPFWDPNFTPPCGQLAAPYLNAHREPRPNFKLYTQI